MPVQTPPPFFRRRTTPPAVVTSFPVGNVAGAGQQPNVHVIDASRNWTLYTRNADTVSEYPASVVKLMTVFLAWEYHGDDGADDWTSTELRVEAADLVFEPALGSISTAGFAEGDFTTWEGLVIGALLPSGGDACQTIARIIGHEIYLAAGSTGLDGQARFVDRMNHRATELGMGNSTFYDPFGGSKTFDPTVVRNTMSPRDLSTICARAMRVPALRAIAGLGEATIPVSAGPHAGGIPTENANRFINGPTLAPAQGHNQNVAGGKTGTWILGAPYNVNQFNLSQLWTTPAGLDLVITTMGSQSELGRTWDQQGMYAMALRDFQHLIGSTTASPDPLLANVKMLVGADGSLTDESPVGRTLTVTSVTANGAPVMAGSSASALFNSAGDRYTAADAADLTVAGGDMTVELFYAQSPAAAPTTELVWFVKSAASNLEWAVNYLSGTFNIFASANGTAWTTVAAVTIPTLARATFFNGAPRHIALVKSGSTWALYLNGERMTGTVTVATAFNGTAPVSVGSGTIAPVGLYDDFRLTMGTARYGAPVETFTPRKFSRS